MNATTPAAAAMLFALATTALAGDDVHVIHGPLVEGDGVAITGVVHAAGAKSVKVAIVRRDWMSAHSWTSSWCQGMPSELTLADGGRFCIDRLVPGTFGLFASADGFAAATTDVGAFADVTDVTLAPTPAANVRISVSLAFEGDVAETWVSVVASGGTTRGYGSPKDGVVDVAGVSPGRYWITARHGHRFHSDKLRETALLVDLKPGANDVAIKVPEAADVRLRARSKSEKEPLEGTLRCRESPDWQVDAPFRVHWDVVHDGIQGMRSAGYGPYWQPAAEWIPVSGIANGAWTLTADALGFAPWEKRVEVKDRADVDVELTPLPGQYFVFSARSVGRRDFALYADVRPASGGAWKPLLVDDDRDTPTDTGESLSARAFLAPGKYVVSVNTPNDAPTRDVLDVTDDRKTLALPWAPAADGRALRGKAKTRGGAVAAGFLVLVLVKDGDTWRALGAKATVVKEDGSFEIRGLPAGACRLAFDDAGAFPFADVEIADKDVEREFVVPATGK
jgi:hypothetical protein